MKEKDKEQEIDSMIIDVNPTTKVEEHEDQNQKIQKEAEILQTIGFIKILKAYVEIFYGIFSLLILLKIANNVEEIMISMKLLIALNLANLGFLTISEKKLLLLSKILRKEYKSPVNTIRSLQIVTLFLICSYITINYLTPTQITPNNPGLEAK